MKLTCITKLRLRVFRDFTWPTELHTFAQFNVIYGWNGSGKTTLSWLLSLVEKKTALLEGEAALEIDGKTKVAGSAFASAQLPQVRVFNRDFIDATLSQIDGDIAPIYFLGEASTDKVKQVEQLKKELATTDITLQTAQVDKAKAESKLDDFSRDKAKLIKELLTTANSQTYNNYDKRNFRRAVEAMDVQQAAAAMLTDDQKAQLRSQKNTQPKPVVEKVAAPPIELDVLTSEVDTLLGLSIVAQTLDELTSNARLATWVQEGLHLHSGEYNSDTCRFCQQPIQASRREELEAHFNDAFEGFQKDLSALLSKLMEAKHSAASLSLPDVSRFYEALVPEESTIRAMVLTAQSETQATLNDLIARVEAKRDQPFAPTATQSHVAAGPSSITDSVAAFNEIVEKHNRITAEFTESVNSACEKLEASYVAEAHAEFAQLSDAVQMATTKLDGIKDTQAETQAKIHKLEREILEHRRPADELTAELCAYLGRDELRFEVKGTGYALTRSGQYVTHLSDGERTAIAFLYFLKSLQDRAFDLKNGIVVIDDPVSSLDDNALFSAFGYMKDRTKDAGQLFILTHSFSFFRLVKNWFHHLPKQRKKKVEDRPARFFLLRTRHQPDGVRTSELGHLDPLLEKYESEYQYLFKRVYEEAHRNDVVQLEHRYGLPNIARRLIEAFLAFRFPEMSGDLYQRLERVNFDNAKKNRIYRLLNTYSHADAIANPNHDLSLLAETQPVLLDTLEMMMSVDREHYDGLLTLVVNQPTEDQGEA
ncbi:MAG: AAA family ATPase [Bradyrhizobiaceae bacterium]|nr:AAA family ATPase [Bradyrhizobiaceae bacterium]